MTVRRVLRAAKRRTKAAADATHEIGKRLNGDAVGLRAFEGQMIATDDAMAGWLPEGRTVRIQSRPEIANMGYWSRRQAKRLSDDQLDNAIAQADLSRKDTYLTRKERRKAEQDYRLLTDVKKGRLESPFDDWKRIDTDDG